MKATTIQPVLVTGGAGYIGSHTCKALADRGFLPITVDNLSAGLAERVQWGPLEIADICDISRSDLATILHDDWIWHQKLFG